MRRVSRFHRFEQDRCRRVGTGFYANGIGLRRPFSHFGERLGDRYPDRREQSSPHGPRRCVRSTRSAFRPREARIAGRPAGQAVTLGASQSRALRTRPKARQAKAGRFSRSGPISLRCGNAKSASDHPDRDCGSYAARRVRATRHARRLRGFQRHPATRGLDDHRLALSDHDLGGPGAGTPAPASGALGNRRAVGQGQPARSGANRRCADGQRERGGRSAGDA